jgi:hypothetical protein
MARGLSKTELEAEWHGLPKDWYSIYQWKRVVGVSYTEWIAEQIASSFGGIRLVTDGLRARSFRVADHRGQITLRTGIEQLTEKRLVRAMFNAPELPLLGRVIDYEVPLKEDDEATHGDIDLLCTQPAACLCAEAKKPLAGESVLKAILQAFAYTSLVTTRKAAFLADFGLDPKLCLTPAVLTFASAQSGRQLAALSKYPKLSGLIRLLNARLRDEGAVAMRFFVVQNPDSQLKRCLVEKREANGDVKAVFRGGFALSISEQVIPA